MKKKLGIVILNYKTYKVTEECVNSIKVNDNIETTIYVVDNNSPNESYAYLSKIFFGITNIKVIKTDVNGGYSRGNNIGILECIKDGIEYIVISNNDVIFTEKSIEILYDSIIFHSDSVIISPMILGVNGIRQNTIVYKKRNLFELMGFHLFSKNLSTEFSGITDVYSISGCCFIINANKFITMGAFDENTFLYNEENIFSFQAAQLKFKIKYNPKSKVIHNHGTTTGTQNMFVNKEFMKSSLYYLTQYEKKNFLKLILFKYVYTLKWLIKSLYVNSMRKEWVKYFDETKIKTFYKKK